MGKLAVVALVLGVMMVGLALTENYDEVHPADEHIPYSIKSGDEEDDPPTPAPSLTAACITRGDQCECIITNKNHTGTCTTGRPGSGGRMCCNNVNKNKDCCKEDHLQGQDQSYECKTSSGSGTFEVCNKQVS